MVVMQRWWRSSYRGVKDLLGREGGEDRSESWRSKEVSLSSLSPFAVHPSIPNKVPTPPSSSSVHPSCSPLPPSPSPRFLIGQDPMALANRAAHHATRHSPIIHCIPQREGGKGKRRQREGRGEGRWLNWWVFPHC